MSRLKAYHFDLLEHLARRRGAVPLGELDGRHLRPLLALGLVAELGDRVSLTPEGERARAGGPPVEARLARRARPAGASTQQPPRWEDVLRTLLRQTGPVPADHIDGRSAQALLERGYIRVGTDDWVSPTPEGRAYFQGAGARPAEGGRGTRRRAVPGGGRGQALLRAVEMLEAAVPLGTELSLGETPAYADDVFAALREVARKMGSGAGEPGRHRRRGR